MFLRERFIWQLGTHSLELGSRTLIMGILNVTPDSFSDGGQWFEPSAAVEHGLRLLEEGADILDIGGESTRPCSTPLAPREEQARVLPVIEKLLHAEPKAILSIDTYHSETARAAVQAGASIVNDVSGHLWDENMSSTCAELGCGVILTHTRGRPSEWQSLPPLAAQDVLPLVLKELGERIQSTLAAGIPREAIVADPGIGFGKIQQENLPLLAHFARLRELGVPLMAGASRKGFLRRILEDAGLTVDSNTLIEATNTAHLAAILGGAHILRVHDVPSARASAAIADRILAAAHETTEI